MKVGVVKVFSPYWCKINFYLWCRYFLSDFM